MISYIVKDNYIGSVDNLQNKKSERLKNILLLFYNDVSYLIRTSLKNPSKPQPTVFFPRVNRLS